MILATHPRCSTTVTLKRADQLSLNDRVLLHRWDGTVELATVQSLVLCGDDVVIEFFEPTAGETTTSIGNTFHTVQ